jgi:hypothetical protein
MGITQQIGASSLIKPGVIDNTAARPASPFEGQVIFQKDTDQLLVWNGTAWVIPNSPAQNPDGLALITTCTVTSAGGTAATVSGGVVTIGTSNTSVTVSSAFSATYDNYVIMISGGVASTDLNLRLTLGSTVTGYYYGGMFAKYDGTNSSFAAVANNTYFDIGYASTNALSGKAELDNPFNTKRTIARTISTGSSTTYFMNNYAGFLNDSTSYTAFTITPSSGNITGGTIRVYGYRNS